MRQSLPDEVKRAMNSFALAPSAAGIPPEKQAGQASAGEGALSAASAPKILCAVSGGADSVSLLLCLKELGYDVSAVHVEHGIRGEESLEDCAFVRRLCEKKNIALCVVSVDAPAAAREDSLTLEEAARQERWKALKLTARRMGIPVVATAHHRMDQAETVLWNLIRGSSIAGLGGIRPIRREDGLILIRPLIDCGKEQIEDYLRQRGVPWRTDSTNLDTRFTRSAIRHKVLPLLEELNPEAQMHIAQAALDLRDAEEWLKEQTDAVWEDVIREDMIRADVIREDVIREGVIREDVIREDMIREDCACQTDLTADRGKLKGCPRVLRHRVLHRMIAQCAGSAKDITRAHVLALDGLVTGPNGREASLPGGMRAVSEEGALRLTRTRAGRVADELPITEDGVFAFPPEGGALRISGDAAASCILADVKYMTWQGGEVPKKRYTKYLAYDTMAPSLVLRTRRDGDYLMVNSALGRRKLKDYLIDEKVPREMRDSIPLIAQGSHVLWVIGMRISEGAKVSRDAKCVRVTVSAFPDGMPGKTAGITDTETGKSDRQDVQIHP